MNRLATIFSIVTTVGVLLAAVSGLVWIIAALRHRETAAKALCIAGIIVAVVGFVLFLRSYDSSLHQERTQEPEPPTTQSASPEQLQEPVSGPEASTQEDIHEQQEPAETPQKPAQAVEAENPLAALAVQEHPVMNGFKTERIGTWASIATTKEFFSDATDEQVFQYLNEAAENNYNWINVFFGDGTGLWCMSSMGGYYIEYGAMDEGEGGAVIHESDVTTRYFRYENGTYVEDTE